MNEQPTQSIHEFATTIVHRLADAQDEGGRLRDPVNGHPVSPREYAQTSFATAAARVARWQDDPELHDAAIAALETYLSTDSAKHSSGEFDAFAIQELSRSNVEMPSGLSESVLEHVEFDAGRRTGQGNNWLLLQTLCRFRRDRPWDRLIARRYLSISKEWEGTDGLLADQPRRPRQTRETPLTYHAKMAMCLVRLAENGIAVGKRADRALATLALLTRSDGEFAYFGRSENALFGYASALDAVIRRRRTHPDPPVWLEHLETRLLQFLNDQFDSSLPSVQPTTDRKYDPIDGYIERTVYGAYAAMLLSGLPDVAFPTSSPADSCPEAIRDKASDAFDTDPVPFRHIMGPRMELTLATRGQMKWTNGGPDPRYAGAIPLSLTIDGDRITAGIPSDYRTARTPPYLPRIETSNGSFVPTTWSFVEEGETHFVARGQFHPVPDEWGKSQPEESNGDNHSPPAADNHRDDTDTVPLPRRLLRRLFSRTLVERTILDRRKQPASIPVSLWRAIHGVPEEGILIIQDLFIPNPPKSSLTLYPASATVKPSASNAVTIRTTDGIPTNSTYHSARSSWGDAAWVCPSSQELTSGISTVLIIDPRDAIDDIEHYMETEKSGATTCLWIDDCTLEFEFPQPE